MDKYLVLVSESGGISAAQQNLHLAG